MTHLAADGQRAAFAACGRVWAWTPPAGEATRVDQPAAARFPSMYEADSSGCTAMGKFWDLAIADSRVAYTVFSGNAGRSWAVDGARLGSPPVPFTLDWKQAAGGIPMPIVAGSGDLLVFSPAPEVVPGLLPVVSRQPLRRAGLNGCPCPDLVEAQRPGGPSNGRVLEPLDVDRGRILAARFDYLFVYDESGNPKLSIDVGADTGTLGDDSIVVAVGSELRHYDAVTGALRSRWGLAARPTSIDTARGLVAYAVAGRILVRRLADDAETSVAPGTLVALGDLGLVYADGSRVHLVPWAQLPPG